MRHDLRHETLTSQHIDVALTYKEMLGLDEALAYLSREKIAPDIAQRVLLTEEKRSPGRSRVAPPPPQPVIRCRRKNRIQDAVVEAALKIERKLGPAWATALLREEKLPEAVVARVVAQGPRQVRTRSIEVAGASAVIPAAR
jgi:hypothetical protein